MQKLTIGSTDVILEDLGEGRGKVIIADFENDAFNYYWGSMGSSLSDFLLGINPDYFAGKLCPHEQSDEFDCKSTFTALRKFIREEMNDELPWYSFMSAQKEMRKKINEMESECHSGEHFVSMMQGFSDSLNVFLLDDMTFLEGMEFEKILSPLDNEPWHFIEKMPSRKFNFLMELLPKIKKELKNQS
jgi:hypothetical protein